MESELSLKALVVMLRATHSVQDVIKRDIEKYGLNSTEFAVLEFLYHKGDQPIQQIGKKILLASSSLTYVVDKLEKKGLVTRVDCENDRRVTYASITAKGNEFMAAAFPKHEQLINEVFSVLSEEELKTVIDLYKRIGKNAEKI